MIPILGETITHRGKFLESSTLELANGGKYEMIKRVGSKNAVAGLVYHKENDTFIFIDQYRYPLRQRILELVAGVCDKNINESDILKEEVQEETGYTEIKNIDFLMRSSNSAGLTCETTALYYVEVVGEKGRQDLGILEDITVLEVKRKDFQLFLKQKVESGMIIDPKVCTSIFLTMEKIGKILKR